MKNSWLSKIMILAMSIAPLLSFNSPVEAQTKKDVYSCINYQGKSSIVVDTDRGRILVFVSESDFFKDSGWTPQKRCNEIANRFQMFSDNKQLWYLTTGKMNGQNIICIGTFRCIDNGLLLTLEGNNDHPNQVLRHLFPDKINHLRAGKIFSNFDRFIDEAPVILQTPTSQMSSPQITSPPQSEPPKENPDCPPLFCD